MKFIRAMKMFGRGMNGIDLTYPLIGARNTFTRYNAALNVVARKFGDLFSDFSRLENVTDYHQSNT